MGEYYMPDYYYDLEDALALGLGAGVMTLLLAFYAVMLLFAVAQYVVNAVAYYRMAKKTGVPRAWMAFVPVADVYLVGKLAEVSNAKKHAKRMLITYCIFLGTMILYFFAFGLHMVLFTGGDDLSAAPLFFGAALLMFAASIVYSVFSYIAIYRICENFGGENAIGWFLGMLLGSIFCSSLVATVLLIILSCKTPAVSQAPTVAAPPPQTDSVF